MPVKVKICGLTNLIDAQMAVNAGADFLGFILYEKSPRYIAPEWLAEFLPNLELPESVLTVGVFVNTPPDEIRSTLSKTGLKLAQLHGDEPEDYLSILDGIGYKAVRPVDNEAAQQVSVFTSYPLPPTPQLLLDAYHPGAYGGTGQQTDWVMAAGVAQRTPRMLLAGGLTAANVQSAITAVKPWGVDVASGVEASPGHKDHALLRDFVANAKGAP